MFGKMYCMCLCVSSENKNTRVSEKEEKTLVCASSSALWMISACLPWWLHEPEHNPPTPSVMQVSSITW